MKTLAYALLTFLLLVHGTSAQIITNFGTAAGDDGLWSYNPVTSTISGTETLGAVLFGTSENISLAGSSGVELTLNVATSPGGGFSVSIYDNVGLEALVDGFTWSAFSGGASITRSYTNIQSGFNFNNVVDWNLNSGGSGNPMTATFDSIAAVPEPSTWVLLAGGLAIILLLRRRRRA